MKILGKLAVAAMLTLATASGTAPAFAATVAVAEEPWATVGYLRGGQWVGGAVLYCDRVETWGEIYDYDTEVWTYYSMCP